MKGYVCIHGHFYQPPRENPWLEEIEQQDSAYPYHDWNERITAECYAPNADSRILDGHDRIVRIVSNYASISFNFGPTLLSWMRRHAAGTYHAILAADRKSIARFGRGSAMAQAYNHLIMPLADDRDRRTQLVWGIADFRYRFGREPEGLWLPETAVDTATLEILAELGIRFTVLAPHQAARVRRLGSGEWRSVAGARIDPGMAYVQKLPSGRVITLFFYDGPASRAVAFEGLLKNGDHFASRLLGLLPDKPDDRLAHIATDGETYGHHHFLGEMALSYAIHSIEQGDVARLTNYAAFLAEMPPTHEVEIIDDTSWSCAHGIERWRSDCGCHTGGEPGWNQAWRAPLREALDWLRDTLNPQFESSAKVLLRDPWAARDAYIDVILDRGDGALDAFFATHAKTALPYHHRVRALELLEMQRHLMLMYTSCGWFFNDVSGIETVQVLQYAGRAVQLAEKLFGGVIEQEFIRRLRGATSNVPEQGDAGTLYERRVAPTKVDLFHVVAHHAVSSLFDAGNGRDDYCYRVEMERQITKESGDVRLMIGRARVTSEVTREFDVVTFAVVHFGGHKLNGGIRRFRGDEAYESLNEELVGAFASGDLSAVLEELNRFPEYRFSLKSLFADRQRQILYRLLHASIGEAESAYRRLFESNESLIDLLAELEMPLPRAFIMAAEFVLNRDLRAALDRPRVDLVLVQSLLDQAALTRIRLDDEALGYSLARTLERLIVTLRDGAGDNADLAHAAKLASLARTLPFEVDFWSVQNQFYALVRDEMAGTLERAGAGDADAVERAALMRQVGEMLAVAVP